MAGLRLSTFLINELLSTELDSLRIALHRNFRGALTFLQKDFVLERLRVSQSQLYFTG